jgi:hypothetical protein
MGSDRQTDPAVVDAACGLIAKGIDVGNADAGEAPCRVTGGDALFLVDD